MYSVLTQSQQSRLSQLSQQSQLSQLSPDLEISTADMKRTEETIEINRIHTNTSNTRLDQEDPSSPSDHLE